MLFEERTRMLFEERTRMLSEKRTRMLSEERTRMLFKERTRMLSEKRTRMLFEERTRMLFEERTLQGRDEVGSVRIAYSGRGGLVRSVACMHGSALSLSTAGGVGSFGGVPGSARLGASRRGVGEGRGVFLSLSLSLPLPLVPGSARLWRRGARWAPSRSSACRTRAACTVTCIHT